MGTTSYPSRDPWRRGSAGSFRSRLRARSPARRLTDTDFQTLTIPERYHPSNVPPGIDAGAFAIVDRFVRAVIDGEPMSPSFDDGLQTQQLIEAIGRSDEPERVKRCPHNPSPQRRGCDQRESSSATCDQAPRSTRRSRYGAAWHSAPVATGSWLPHRRVNVSGPPHPTA